MKIKLETISCHPPHQHLSKREEAFDNPLIANPIIDKLFYHSKTIKITVKPYRLKKWLKRTLHQFYFLENVLEHQYVLLSRQ